MCSEDQHILYAATRHQAIEVHCQVEADPSNVTFEWFFHLNGNAQQGKKIEAVRSQGTLSIATYTAHGHGDFGTLTCQAKNRIGSSCSFVENRSLERKTHLRRIMCNTMTYMLVCIRYEYGICMKISYLAIRWSQLDSFHGLFALAVCEQL